MDNKIDKNSIRNNLRIATKQAIDQAKQQVYNDLEFPKNLRYRFRNDDSICTESEIIDRIFENNQCPIWIDIYVYSVFENVITIMINMSSKKTDSRASLRYLDLGCPPFQASGPLLPPNWSQTGSTEESNNKFDINFHTKKI